MKSTGCIVEQSQQPSHCKKFRRIVVVGIWVSGDVQPLKPCPNGHNNRLTLHILAVLAHPTEKRRPRVDQTGWDGLMLASPRMVAIVKSNRVVGLQIDVAMRLGRCSDDESDSYAWVPHFTDSSRGLPRSSVAGQSFRSAAIGPARFPRSWSGSHRRIDLHGSCRVLLCHRGWAPLACAIAQTKPANSRATATHTLLWCTPLAFNRA